MNNLRRSILCLLLAATLLAFQHCSQDTSDEAVARRYCGSCHLFPEPSLLPKQTWDKGVLPAMMPLLGLINDRNNPYGSLSMDEIMYLESAHYFPDQPVLSEEEWEQIKSFYQQNAPDSLPQPEGRQPILDLESRFDFKPITGLTRLPSTTLVKYFPAEKRIVTGFQDGTVLMLDDQFQRRDSLRFASAVSDVVRTGDDWYFSEMGRLNPSDIFKGAVWSFNGDLTGKTQLIGTLNRPAEIQWADITGDRNPELILCEFGHQLGSFSWFGKEGKDRHTLINVPGARTAKVTDLDGDGLQDLVVLFAQGNECVRWFRNEGGGNFSQNELLRFPSVHGSSYLELVDMNNDGHDDIIIANGDNADYSVVFKPWHGVTIYLNDGRQHFTQAWFYPMNGASKTLTRDFDGDGDPDIAAMSFFPDLQRVPEESFLYFENRGNLRFDVYGSPKTAAGRWLVMDAADVNADGKEDLLLGSCVTAMRLAGTEIYAREWVEGNVSVLGLFGR